MNSVWKRGLAAVLCAGLLAGLPTGYVEMGRTYAAEAGPKAEEAPTGAEELLEGAEASQAETEETVTEPAEGASAENSLAEEPSTEVPPAEVPDTSEESKETAEKMPEEETEETEETESPAEDNEAEEQEEIPEEAELTVSGNDIEGEPEEELESDIEEQIEWLDEEGLLAASAERTYVYLEEGEKFHADIVELAGGADRIHVIDVASIMSADAAAVDVTAGYVRTVNYSAAVNRYGELNGEGTAINWWTDSWTCPSCRKQYRNSGTDYTKTAPLGMPAGKFTFTCPHEEEDPSFLKELADEYRVWAWFEEETGTVYLYNPAGSEIYTNKDSRGLFASLPEVKRLPVTTRVNTSKTSDFRDMFKDCPQVEALDLSRFDKHGNDTGMLAGMTALNTLTFGTQWVFSMNLGIAGTVWHKDGDFSTYTMSGGTGNGSDYGFENVFNLNPEEMAGTYLKNDGHVHQYYATGGVNLKGNMYETDHPEDRFVAYCWAQHCRPNKGYYDRYRIDSNAQVMDILRGGRGGDQTQFCKALLGRNMRETLVALAYYGYPNDADGIQKKYKLKDYDYMLITQSAVWACSDGRTYDYSSGMFGGDAATIAAYEELLSKRYANIPNAEELQLYVYLAAHVTGGQQMLSIAGVVRGERGGVMLRKQDEDGNGLQGAEFEIRNAQGEVVHTIVSDGEGLASLCQMDEAHGLLPGTYTVREIVPPAGYELTEDSYTFTVEKGGQIVETGCRNDSTMRERMIFTDAPKPEWHGGGLRIRKTAAGSGAALAGAVYAVCDSEGQEILRLSTDENGMAETSVNRLELGSYLLQEIAAPAGFCLQKDLIPVVIEQENDWITVNLTDEARQASLVLQATKTILPEGHSMPEGHFQFELLEQDEQEEWQLIDTAANDAEGKVTFRPIVFNGDDSQKDLSGMRHFAVREVRNAADSRYVYDEEMKYVTVLYGDSESDTDSLVLQQIGELTFTNTYKEPPVIEPPIKRVTEGETIEEGLHNRVSVTEPYLYDIYQTIPMEEPMDRFESLVFRDVLPAGVALERVQVFADDVDVTQNFALQTSGGEMGTGKVGKKFVPTEVCLTAVTDLTAEAVYGKTYDFRLYVSVQKTETKEVTYENDALIEITYLEPDNPSLELKTNRVKTDVLPVKKETKPKTPTVPQTPSDPPAEPMDTPASAPSTLVRKAPVIPEPAAVMLHPMVTTGDANNIERLAGIVLAATALTGILMYLRRKNGEKTARG